MTRAAFPPLPAFNPVLGDATSLQNQLAAVVCFPGFSTTHAENWMNVAYSKFQLSFKSALRELFKCFPSNIICGTGDSSPHNARHEQGVYMFAPAFIKNAHPMHMYLQRCLQWQVTEHLINNALNLAGPMASICLGLRGFLGHETFRVKTGQSQDSKSC